jgi:flagellin-like protein
MLKKVNVFMNKRGMSPLFATVLLIAFSVALGAVVMSWGESYIEEKAEFVQGVQEIPRGCDAVMFSIMNVHATPQICQKDNTITVFLDNGPDVALANVQAKVVGDDVSVAEGILPAQLPRSGSVKSVFAFAPVGQIREVKFTPIIWKGQDVIYCPQKAIRVEGVNKC